MASKSGKSSINTFSAGINLDVDKSLLKPNQYRYAENVRVTTNESSTTGALTNIEGSLYMDSISFATGETIVASHTVRDFGVLFTVLSSGLNKIYRLVFKTDGTLDTTSTIDSLYIGTKNVLTTNGIELGLNPGDAISIVSRYEDDDNIKVYWADGKSFIRSINIAPSNDTQNASVTLSSSFDIIPSADLKVPVIASIGSGRLNAGIIQYFYQLYGPSGTETMLSPGSAPINLTASDIQDKSIKYLGTGVGEVYGKPTGKSVKVGIEIPAGNIFKRVKLISVYYYDYSEIPVINIVKELSISGNEIDGFIYLEDGGATVIGELTQAEFNLIGGNLFIPNYLESKDNILFAANVKEDTWDIEDGLYDTRSYQFNSSKASRLFKGDLVSYNDITDQDIVGGPGMAVITSTHDTINKEIYSTERYADLEYKYNVDGNLGGTGLNVDYLFTNTYFIESYGNYWDSQTTPIVETPIYTHPIGGYTYTKTVLSQSGANSIYIDNSSNIIKPGDRIVGTANRITTIVGASPSEVTFIGPVFYSGGDTIQIENVEISSYITTGGELSEADRYIDQRTARIGDVKRSISDIRLYSSDGTSIANKNISDFGVKEHEGPLNYSNPYLANILKSYQRDEIYRFAAVFHDEKGRKSPAHWIGDIRFPAGYEESTNWTSSIFEMPSETYNDGYSDDFTLKNQELLVKPLGITFNFKHLNLIPGVKKIEIVRAKRDINNKTIYAQGVLQKTGTQYKEYKNGSTTEYINTETTGMIHPHPVVSMNDHYSIAGLMNGSDLGAVHNTPGRTFYELNTVNLNYDDNFVNDYWYPDTSQIRSNLNYSDHTISPFYSNRSNYLFANPETSFYGVDFVEQIKNALPSSYIDIVDLISPLSTPPVIGMSDSTGGDAYIGRVAHEKLQFKSNHNNEWYPSAMYFGADIAPKSKLQHGAELVKSSNHFYGLGLVGAYYQQISGSNGDFRSYENRPTLTVGMPSGVMDIRSLSSFTKFYARSKTGFISLGGICDWKNAGSFTFKTLTKDGEDIDATTGSTQSIYEDLYNDNSRGAVTFKYFSRYFKKRVGEDYGGNQIYLLYRNSYDYADVTTYHSSSIGVPGGSDNFIKKINSFEYSGNIVAGKSIGQSVVDSVQVGDSTYINWSKPLTTGDAFSTSEEYLANCNAKTKASGPHGAGIVLNFDDDNKIPLIELVSNDKKKHYNGDEYYGYKQMDSIGSNALSTYVTNIKLMNDSIYGGKSIIDRQFTEYISTGAYIDNNNTSSVKTVFGGDTFIGLFDYDIVRASDPYVEGMTGPITTEGVASVTLNQVKYIGALIPLESSINMHLVNSKAFVASGYNFAIQPEPGVYSPAGFEGGTWTKSQELPQFDYNAAYSAEQTAIGNTSKLLISESDNVFDCRVYSSEPKTNDELYDKWATFKEANYIDVDTQFGEITGLKKFNDKLFFWQKNAFGVLSVNERSLIKDNNISSLTLGTGGILTRFDYITTSNGFRKGMIGGITQSEGNLYWMDADNAELCVFSGSVTPLSKAKGIQTYLNQNKSNIQNHIPMIFDKKYNEIILTLNGLTGADSIV